MKKLMVVGVAALAIGFVLLLAPLASAQGILNGQWFEVKVKTKTLWWQGSTIPIESRTDSFTAYMQLVWLSENSGVQNYTCHLWTRDGTGAWVNRSNPSWWLYDEDDQTSLVSNASMVWYVGGDDRYTTEANIRVKISTDSTGVFKKATFDALGCIVGIALDGGSDSYGGCTMKGKSLRESPIN